MKHRLRGNGHHQQLVELAVDIAGKKLSIRHIPGPLGVRGRNSDNRLIEQKLNWKPSQSLRAGLEKTYRWIDMQVQESLVATAAAR